MTTPEIELGMDSYPPALLVGGPVSARRMRARTGAAVQRQPEDAATAHRPSAAAPDSQSSSPRLTVTAGAPGGYTPAVRAADRPRNITELSNQAEPADRAPWTVGQYVSVGTSGKRAHWTGTEWRGGESPGYLLGEPPVQLTETPEGTQFPGDDTAEDLHR